MKDKTKRTIVGTIAGGWVALGFAWSSLSMHEIVKNHLEDRTAIAWVDASEGDIIDHSRGYVAFDRSGDGQIDEIKVYRRGLVGCRTCFSEPYTIRYYKDSVEFERLKQKYFSNIR
ncbi:MAG: hypothetical protein HY363_05530 [Candidatus Aenigmarchaeota archaeon]|nr:hypothetical protein [Candidatus Aenigmarchaeota archaeon]